MVAPVDPRHDPRPVMLVLRALKLGDLLVAVPALTALRRSFPDHRIVLATTGWLRPIVELVDGVDELVPTPGLSRPIEVGGRAVDVAANLHGRGPESADLLAALHPRSLIAHRPDAPGGPSWVDGMLERERWARLVRAFGADADAEEVGIAVPAQPAAFSRAAVVHVGAFYGSRRWPAERFAEVARHLERAGGRVLITGGEADRERAVAVARAAGLDTDRVLAGRIGLAEFAAIVAAARVLVSVDTGAAHLASAYGIPSVVLFGPAPPSEWGPPPGPHLVLTRADVRRGETFSDEPDPALLAVQVEDVVDALDRLRAGP